MFWFGFFYFVFNLLVSQCKAKRLTQGKAAPQERLSF